MEEKPNPEKAKNRFDAATKEKIDPIIWEECQKAMKEDQGLFIFGKVGTGKTFLCHALAKETKYHTEIQNIPEILLRMKATFNENKRETEEEIINELVGNPNSRWDRENKKILILDDLGTEKPTEWAQQNLFLIINQRYEKMRQTIFTSNLSLDELSERLGDRITSRIAEMCKIIELTGKDRRIK